MRIVDKVAGMLVAPYSLNDANDAPPQPTQRVLSFFHLLPAMNEEKRHRTYLISNCTTLRHLLLYPRCNKYQPACLFHTNNSAVQHPTFY
jgi:hypothetical protein